MISMSFFSFLFFQSCAAALWRAVRILHRRLRSVYFIIIICQMFGGVLNNYLSISNPNI